MKNKIIFVFFLVLSIFIFNDDVNAKTKTGINIDANEHFNYYYEQKNGTNFYNTIRNLSINKSHVHDFFGVNEEQAKNYNLYAFYSSDLQNAEIKKYNYANANNRWYEDVSIPNNSYYALVFVYFSFNDSSSFPKPITSIDGNNYSINYRSFPQNTDYYN